MTEPLVPADVDLRDFAFMPLDVARLRDSAIVDEIDGDAFRAAILLWCASWHQVPAGSLPKDAKQLSKFAGYGRVVSEWEKVADGALYGWVECSDGRLYHPVIAEKAIEAWEKKSEYTQRSTARADQARAAAEARWGKKDGPDEGGAGPASQGGGTLKSAPAADASAGAGNQHSASIAGALPKGNRQGQGIDRDNASAAAGLARRGSDELGGRLRPLVGSLPVVVDADLSPILRLLAEGLTMGDVEAGITVCVERSRKKPRAWGDFENWIRRAAKDRLEAEGQRPFGQRLDRPAALPDPAAMRRHLVTTAASFLRGDNHPNWSSTKDPDSPDCTLPEDVIADARAIIEMERAETPQQKAKRLGFVLDYQPLH